MGKRGQRKRKPPVGDPTDPRGFQALMDRYLTWMRVQNYSPRTIRHRETYLRRFFQWALERGLRRPAEITKPMLERYKRHLYFLRTKTGKPLSFRGQRSYLASVRTFFKWLCRKDFLLANPASELDLPRQDRRLPKAVLTETEAEKVLAQPDLDTPHGLRDRAIMETFYSTGMRRSELIGLELGDVDAERGTVLIRQGKGKKDRMVPIGKRALAWLEKYTLDVRPTHDVGAAGPTLFLTQDGLSLSPSLLTHTIKRYVDAADLGKSGSCHLFRHTCATLMLEGGADTRYIQQLLGHAKLETTQVYTHIAIRRLKEVHTACHPAKFRDQAD